MQTKTRWVLWGCSALLACGYGSATGPIGPHGGAVSLQGLTVDVPEGAVDDTVQVTVREVQAAERGDRAFELEPRDLVFKVPAVLRVDDATGLELRLEGGQLQGEWRGRQFEAELRHLGHFELHRRGADDTAHPEDRDGGTASGGACVDDDSCPCGSECVSGACTAVTTCTSNAQCPAGQSCRAAQRHGQSCGVNACHP